MIKYNETSRTISVHLFVRSFIREREISGKNLLGLIDKNSFQYASCVMQVSLQQFGGYLSML